jgi:hypothetical protein
MFRHFNGSLDEVHLESCFPFKWFSWSRNLQYFLKHKGSLLRSEDLPLVSYPKADESSLHPTTHEATNNLCQGLPSEWK